MNKKLILKDLDIPTSDMECWERYPKHRWVYEKTRLLDSQNITWSLFSTKTLGSALKSIDIDSREPYKAGEIFVKEPHGLHMLTEVFIVKGEIKHIRHIDPQSREIQSQLIGEIELRLNAFVTLHFQKFTGIITAETYSNEIYNISLKPQSDLGQETNSDIVKLLKRIYKKTDLTLSGLSDQVFQVSLAS